jgi:hypothetical protein
MQERKYKIGDGFFISSPNFGDGELREITFSHPNITLKIYAPVEGITFAVELERVSSLSFSTNHPQNVMEGIRVYPSRESIPLAHKNLVAALPPTAPQAQDEVVVLIEPIAGPTLACTCKTLRVFLND